MVFLRIVFLLLFSWFVWLGEGWIYIYGGYEWMDGISSLFVFGCGVDFDGYGGGWDDMDVDSNGESGGGIHEGKKV